MTALKRELRPFLNRGSVSIFSVAITARIGVALIQIAYGIHSISIYDLVEHSTSSPNITYFPDIAAWHDFYTFYGSQLDNLIHGLLPYKDFAYSYPPLFIYSLYPFYIIGGIHAASVPILFSDAATASVIYLTVRQSTNYRIAAIAGLLYALSPLALFVEGYQWLSSQPMVLLLILSIFFLRRKNPLLASLCLSVSFLFKQEAFFILPVYVIVFLTQYRDRIWKTVAIFGGVLTIVSLPFLVIAPKRYLNSLSYGALANIVGNGSTLSENTTGSQAVQTLSTLSSQTCSTTPPAHLTGTFVACGVTYSSFAPTLFDQISTLFGLISWVAYFTAIPLVVMTGLLLYLSRKQDNFLEIASAYSIIAFLVLFSVLVHGLYLYYFLPAFVLLFASVRNKSTALIAVIASVLSIVALDLTFDPVLLTLLALVGILVTSRH